MRYRKRNGQQYSLYRVKYRYTGKTRYTSPFKTWENAERWKNLWEALPRPAQYSGDSIAQVVSNVTPIQPSYGSRYVQQWKVRSERNPSKFYTVSLKHDGSYECSCPHWIYRHKECKHIRKVKGRGCLASKTNFFIDENGVKQCTLI